MSLAAHIRLLADYNRVMNEKLYAAAAKLPPAELAADRKAFFGSLLGTLNHLVVTDTLWWKRCAAHPAGHKALDPIRALAAPAALNQILFTELAPLAGRRVLIDAALIDWSRALTEADLEHKLEYRNVQGVPSRRSFATLVLGVFNHQTHHRGQASTLLTQAGVDLGVTDLLPLIPDELAA